MTRKVAQSAAGINRVVYFAPPGEPVKSVPHTPGYIYLIAIVLALPLHGSLWEELGEDVPGMIAMVVTVVFFGVFTIALGSLRRLLQSRCRGGGVLQTISRNATPTI